MTYNEERAISDAMPFAAGLIKLAENSEINDGRKYCRPLLFSENRFLKNQYDTIPALSERKREYKRKTGAELEGIDYAFPCITDKHKEDMAAAEQRRRAADTERNRRECFTYPAMRGYTFIADDNKNPALTNTAKEYVQYFDNTMRPNGLGVLMFGGVGTGKTFMACCIANALTDSGRRCRVTSFADIVTELEDFKGRQTVLKRLTGYDLVVLDDLGTERQSGYMAERVFTIIDALYKANTPLIVTTNLTMSEMSDNTDINRNRVYDRIKERCAVLMEFKGASRRTAKARENSTVFRSARNS